MGKITNMEMRPIIGQNAGHKMVFVEIDEGLEMGKGYWKFNTSNLRDQKYNDEIKQTWVEAKEMKGDFDNAGEWWDFSKRLLRNVGSSFQA